MFRFVRQCVQQRVLEVLSFSGVPGRMRLRCRQPQRIGRSLDQVLTDRLCHFTLQNVLHVLLEHRRECDSCHFHILSVLVEQIAIAVNPVAAGTNVLHRTNSPT